MRRITLWAMSTVTVLVLLLSYNTSKSSGTIGATSTTSQVFTSQGSAPSGTSSDEAVGSARDASSETFVGDEVVTRYGVVQVEITVADGVITAAEAVQVPMQDRHDQIINSVAVPIYNSEAVLAQSADIDVVSGATVTWEGYTASLQSAIDQAHR